MIRPYGYFTQIGYIGYVEDRMMFFATEDEYLEYIESYEKETDYES